MKRRAESPGDAFIAFLLDALAKYPRNCDVEVAVRERFGGQRIYVKLPPSWPQRDRRRR